MKEEKERGDCLSTQKRGLREIGGHDGLWVATAIISIHCACLQESITTESADCRHFLVEEEDAVSHVT